MHRYYLLDYLGAKEPCLKNSSPSTNNYYLKGQDGLFLIILKSNQRFNL